MAVRSRDGGRPDGQDPLAPASKSNLGGVLRGMIRIENIDPGSCKLTLPDLDASAWGG